MADDSEIEIIEKDTTNLSDDICQLCSARLRGLSDTERDDHYKEHYSGQTTSSRPKQRKSKQSPGIGTSRRKISPMRLVKKAKNDSQMDVFWYPAHSEAPPENYTPGALSILKEALKKSYKKGVTQRAVLCYERTPHILREQFDMNWGCGYRNFLMTCAALMDQQSQALYFPHLDSPSPPSVRNLQRWIEDAWGQGYDEIGARELNNKLVDTNKKIGTGDLYVAFTSRKIPCVLVDFDPRNSPKGFDTLTEWVVNYFTEKPEGDVNKILLASPVVSTGKMPVILQFDGHSVTIVGYELVKNDKYHLLVFDPSCKIPDEIRQAALNAPTSADRVFSSPHPSGKNRRHGRSKSPSPRKRSRTDKDPDAKVVNIPDSDEEVDDTHPAVALESTLDIDKVLKTFRLTKPKYKRKRDYQLLYFTLGDLLSDQEQNDRKVVLADC